MKIINATVVDPRKKGKIRTPYLVVEVDEDVHSTGPKETKRDADGIWEIGPMGPFTTVDWYDNISHEVSDGDLGRFNTLRLLPPLVYCTILSPTEEIRASMKLDRARRLLRKFNTGYRYALHDVEAQRGMIQWYLTEMPLTCVRCGTDRKVKEVYFRGTYMAVCVEHLAALNDRLRDIRLHG